MKKVLLTMLLTTLMLGASPVWAKDCLKVIRYSGNDHDYYEDDDYVFRNTCDKDIAVHYCFEEVSDWEDEYGDINSGNPKCPDVDSDTVLTNDDSWVGEAVYPGPLHWVECVDRGDKYTENLDTGITTHVYTVVKSKWTGSKLVLEKCNLGSHQYKTPDFHLSPG